MKRNIQLTGEINDSPKISASEKLQNKDNNKTLHRVNRCLEITFHERSFWTASAWITSVAASRYLQLVQNDKPGGGHSKHPTIGIISVTPTTVNDVQRRSPDVAYVVAVESQIGDVVCHGRQSIVGPRLHHVDAVQRHRLRTRTQNSYGDETGRKFYRRIIFLTKRFYVVWQIRSLIIAAQTVQRLRVYMLKDADASRQCTANNAIVNATPYRSKCGFVSLMLCNHDWWTCYWIILSCNSLNLTEVRAVCNPCLRSGIYYTVVCSVYKEVLTIFMPI